MRENPKLDRNGILTFSRTVPSFYTLLCKEVYGVYENSGVYYNRARALHRKITTDDKFVQEMINYDLNRNDDEDNNELGYDFVFVNYSHEKEYHGNFRRNEVKVMEIL